MASQVSAPDITYSRSPLLSQYLSKETLFTRVLHHVLAEHSAFDGRGGKRSKWQHSAGDVNALLPRDNATDSLTATTHVVVKLLITQVLPSKVCPE